MGLTPWYRVGRISLRLEFKWQDMWVGAYPEVKEGIISRRHLHVWVCILPMLPIHITVWPRGL